MSFSILAMLCSVVYVLVQLNISSAKQLIVPLGVTVCLFVTNVVFLFTTSWINDFEFGLTGSKALNTGVHAFYTQGCMQIPRNDSISLLKASNIGDVEIAWSVAEPEKLVNFVGEIRSFRGAGGGSDQWAFREWVSVKLLTVTPKARQLLIPAEDSLKLNEDFAR